MNIKANAYNIKLREWMLCFILSVFVSSVCFGSTLLVHQAHAQTIISQDSLRAIYSMRQRAWPDGTPVTVFMYAADSELHRNFCLRDLELFPYQLQRVWDVLIYSGAGQSPVRVKSKDEMLKKISSTVGAIGYVAEKGVASNVKIIKLQK